MPNWPSIMSTCVSISNAVTLSLSTHLTCCYLFDLLQVREIQFSFNKVNLRWQSAALEALQAASEDFLVQLLEDAYVLIATALLPLHYRFLILFCFGLFCFVLFCFVWLILLCFALFGLLCLFCFAFVCFPLFCLFVISFACLFLLLVAYFHQD